MTPVGKARPRVTRNGAFTPEKTVNAERLVAWACKKAMAGARPLKGPLWLEVEAWFLPPKQAASPYKTTKPDLDNILKLVGDALNKIAWHDDSQVIRASAWKGYSLDGEQGLTISFGSD